MSHPGAMRGKRFLETIRIEAFLNTLYDVNRRYNWLCHAYCLMNNHYHLVIETPDGNLSKGMRQLNGVYTKYLISVIKPSVMCFREDIKLFLSRKIAISLRFADISS